MNDFLWGVYPYVCLTLFFVVPIIRMVTRPFTWSTRASGLFGAPLLGVASLCLHWGLFGLFAAHLAGFIGGLTGRADLMEFFRWVGLVFGLVTLLGSVLALARRASVPEVRAMSLSDDYLVHVFLIAILSLALYQVLVHRLFGLAYTAAPWLASVIRFSPQPELMESASLLTQLHIFLAFTFFAYFPFTKLVHFWTYPLAYFVRPYQSMRTSRYVFEARWDFNLSTDKSWMVAGMVVLVLGFAGLSGLVAKDGRLGWSATSVPNLEGQALYLSQCARCHGVTGAGDGPGAGSPTFWAAPRNFTHGQYYFISTKNGTASDEDLTRVIRQGLPPAGMPAFPALTDAQVQSLVQHLRGLSQTAPYPGSEVQVPVPPADGPEVLARGRQLFAANCSVCHGNEGRGDGPAAAALSDVDGRPVRPANLAAGRLKAGAEGEQLYLRVACGIPGGKAGFLMPAFSQEAGGKLTPEEIWALVDYLRAEVLPQP